MPKSHQFTDSLVTAFHERLQEIRSEFSIERAKTFAELGTHMRSQREFAGITITTLARHLGCKTAWLYRCESGATGYPLAQARAALKMFRQQAAKEAAGK